MLALISAWTTRRFAPKLVHRFNSTWPPTFAPTHTYIIKAIWWKVRMSAGVRMGWRRDGNEHYQAQKTSVVMPACSQLPNLFRAFVHSFFVIVVNV